MASTKITVLLALSAFLIKVLGARPLPQGQNETQAPSPAPGPSPFSDADYYYTDPGGSTAFTLSYQGGNIFYSPVILNIIFYGPSNEWTTAQINMVKTFVSSITGSSPSNVPSVTQWWKTVTKYTDSGSRAATASVSLGSTVRDTGSLGTVITEAQIQTLIKNQIANGAFPASSSHMYAVLTSQSVKAGGYCASYCGLHSSFSLGTTKITYSFAGNAAKCLNHCPINNNQNAVVTSGDPGTEGLINVFAHELAESVVDPFGTGWYLSGGGKMMEIADVCYTSFGSPSTASNGGLYNLVGYGGSKLLLQGLYSRVSGSCALSS